MNPVLFYEYGKSRNDFISTWKTDNTSTGSSVSTQVRLPLHVSGTYNFFVDWGDGLSDIITSYNQAEVTHTYAVAGTYQIKIKGTCTGWFFNNTGDKLKMLSVQRWGCFRLTSIGGYFYGCANLNLSSVTDVLQLSGIANGTAFFRDCTALTTINRIGEWAMGSFTLFNQFFTNCVNMNADIHLWNVTSGVNYTQMLYNCTLFNKPIGTWNMTSAINLTEMLRMATKFNQNISAWNIINVTGMIGFMQGKTAANYSAANYDALLIAWSALIVKPNLTPNFGTIKYTSAASFARAILTGAPNNWTIADGGL